MYYVLDGRTPVRCASVEEWAKRFEASTRIVKQEQFGDAMVSTVFLGLDHRWGEGGPPILFETMVFDEGDCFQIQLRCCTYLQAEEMHEKVVALVQASQAKALALTAETFSKLQVTPPRADDEPS